MNQRPPVWRNPFGNHYAARSPQPRTQLAAIPDTLHEHQVRCGWLIALRVKGNLISARVRDRPDEPTEELARSAVPI